MRLQQGTSLLEFLVVSVLSALLLCGAISLVQSLLHLSHQQRQYADQQQQLWLLADFLKHQMQLTHLPYCGVNGLPDSWQIIQNAGHYDAQLLRRGSGQALLDLPVLVLRERQDNCDTAMPISSGNQGLQYPCGSRLRAHEWILIQDCMHFVLRQIRKVSQWQGKQWLTLTESIGESFKYGALISVYQEVAFYFGRNVQGEIALYQQINHGSRQEVATLPGMYWELKSQSNHLWAELDMDIKHRLGRLHHLHVWLA